MRVLKSIRSNGQKVDVVLATPEEIGDENLLSHSVYGTFDQCSNTIHLNETSLSLSNGSLPDIVGHEMGHAWFGMTGARYYLSRLLRQSSDEFDFVEENLIRQLTPAIISSVPDLYWYCRKYGVKP